MSREKKSQVDDVAILRKILDNSSDPALDSLIPTNAVALDSVRRRLGGYTIKTHAHSYTVQRRYNSLEPRVTLRPMITPRSRLIPSYSSYQSSTPIPEFTIVSLSTQEITASAEKVCVPDEELFEVEKVPLKTPEFLEVTPKEPEGSLEGSTTITETQAQGKDTDLPEWQPIQEVQSTEMLPSNDTPGNEYTQEFEQSVSTQKPDSVHTTTDDKTTPLKEVSREISPEFLPIEPQGPLFTQFTRKQIRDAKKAQKKMDKEAKRLKKLEMKRKKIEQREKEGTETQIFEEQRSNEQIRAEQLSYEEGIAYIESPQMNIDYNAFDGIACIDDRTAELLYKNGYFSIDNLRVASIDDLVKIQGIKRKLAKQIKKELDQKIQLTNASEFVPARHKISKKKSKAELEDTTEWETPTSTSHGKKQSTNVPYKYKGYTLYKRHTVKHHGKKTTIHFFSKEKPNNAEIAQLPDGYHIAVNRKTKIPYLRKKG